MDKNHDINTSSSHEKSPKISHSHERFPSIKSLFKDSFHVFKRSFFQLFLFSILPSIVIYTSFLLIAGYNPFGSYQFINDYNANLGIVDNLSLAPWSLVFIWLALVMFGGIFFSIATIIAIDNSGKKSIGSIFKMSYKLILPLLAASSIMIIIIMGGYFLFILPGILFSMYFIFYAYEVILNNQRWSHALKSSYAIVYKHFWYIFIRVLIVYIFNLIVSGIFGIIADKNENELTHILELVYYLVFECFWVAYLVTLYKQAKSVTKNEGGKSFGWIGIVSSIGWGIFIGWMILFLIVSAIVVTTNSNNSRELQNINTQEQYKMDYYKNTTDQYLHQ